MSTFSPLLIVISAPSGAGKTTLCTNVLAADPRIQRAVTCTTRPPRNGELNGVDYHFLSPADFQQKVANREFLEHATVFGNQYGTLKSEVLNRLRQGQDVLLNIDVQGAASIRQHAAADPALQKPLVSVFLTPATFDTLAQRLRNRAQDSEEIIQRRLNTARQELAEWKHFDYLIISDTRESDLRNMQAILTAEHLRRNRVTPPQL